MTIVISDCTQYVPLVRTDVQAGFQKSVASTVCLGGGVQKSKATPSKTTTGSDDGNGCCWSWRGMVAVGSKKEFIVWRHDGDWSLR